jgi:hypothetical protein
MLTFLVILGYILFVLVLAAGVVATLLGLPGTVLILANAIVFSAITGWERPEWWVLIVLAALALLAEVGDNVLAALGTRYSGGSSKTGWIAMLGGIAGALVGSALSPVLGAVGGIGGPLGFIIGVVIIPLGLAALGAYYAVYWYEVHQGRSRNEAITAAKGALFGRLLGVMGKALLAVIMSGIVLWTVFVPLLRQG